MVCRVALALGKHLHEVEALPLSELRRWAAYDRVEGLPDSWLQTGLIASLIYNVNRGRAQPSLTPADFTPGRRTGAKAQAAAHQAAMAALKAMARRSKQE